MKATRWGQILLAGSLLVPGLAAAQQQSSSSQQTATPPQKTSLGDAARRAREMRKDQPKAGRVWDNDNIPAAGAVNVVGKAPASPSEGTAAQASTPATEKPEAQPPAGALPPATPANDAETAPRDKAQLEAALAQAKEKLQTLQTDLDILQRKYVLDQQQFYSNPDYSKDTGGLAKLKDEESQVDAKRQEVADAKKAVDDLQAKLNAAKKTGTR